MFCAHNRPFRQLAKMKIALAFASLTLFAAIKASVLPETQIDQMVLQEFVPTVETEARIESEKGLQAGIFLCNFPAMQTKVWPGI